MTNYFNNATYQGSKRRSITLLLVLSLFVICLGLVVAQPTPQPTAAPTEAPVDIPVVTVRSRCDCAALADAYANLGPQCTQPGAQCDCNLMTNFLFELDGCVGRSCAANTTIEPVELYWWMDFCHYNLTCPRSLCLIPPECNCTKLANSWEALPETCMTNRGACPCGRMQQFLTDLDSCVWDSCTENTTIVIEEFQFFAGWCHQNLSCPAQDCLIPANATVRQETPPPADVAEDTSNTQDSTFDDAEDEGSMYDQQQPEDSYGDADDYDYDEAQPEYYAYHYASFNQDGLGFEYYEEDPAYLQNYHYNY